MLKLFCTVKVVNGKLCGGVKGQGGNTFLKNFDGTQVLNDYPVGTGIRNFPCKVNKPVRLMVGEKGVDRYVSLCSPLMTPPVLRVSESPAPGAPSAPRW